MVLVSYDLSQEKSKHHGYARLLAAIIHHKAFFLLFKGVPLRVGLSAISFFPSKRAKKDAAAIPNAALEHQLKQRNLEKKKKAQNMSFFYNLNS